MHGPLRLSIYDITTLRSVGVFTGGSTRISEAMRFGSLYDMLSINMSSSVYDYVSLSVYVHVYASLPVYVSAS